MTSRCNRNMVHALTTYPTHPKFGKAVTCRLSQKTTPQVIRPVVVAVHVRVNKIHVRNKKKKKKKINHQQPRTQPNNQAPPTNPTIQRQKTSSPKPQHPTKQTTYPANPYKANYTPANISKTKSPQRHHKQLI